MSDFTINIDSKLDLSKARSEMNSFLSEFKNEPIKINVELDPKSINTTNFGKQIQSSLNSSVKNVHFSGDTFYKEYFDQAKKDVDEAKRIEKAFKNSILSTDTSDINKNAIKAVNARKSAETKAQKEILAQQKQQQKEIDAIENARIKSVENASKREAKIVQQQNSAINKALENRYKQQQKEIKLQEASKQKALLYTKSASSKLTSAIDKYSYGDSTEAKKLSQMLNRGLSNFGDYSNIDGTIAKLDSEVNSVISTLKKSHDTSLNALNQEINAELKLQSQKDSFNKRNISNIDLEIQRREENSKIFSAQLKAQMEEEQKWQDYTSKIQSEINNGKYDAKSSIMQSRLNDYGNQDTELIRTARQQVELYNNTISNLKRHFDSNDAFSMNDEEMVNSFNNMANAAEKFDNTMTQIRNTGSKSLGLDIAKRSADEVESYMNANSRALKKYKTELIDLQNQYRQMTTVAEKADLDNKFKNLKATISAEGLSGRSILEEMGRGMKVIGQFATTYGVIQRIPETIMNMANAVIEVDTAMTNLYKVTDETDAKYSEFLSNASKNAKSLGRDISSYITQTSEWAKLGYNMNSSSELAKVSSIYANVGEVDDKTAVSDLVTVMKAYNMQDSQAMNIADMLNELGNNYATSAGDLGAGLTKMASTMSMSNVSLEKSLAILTGGTEITQNAEELGNAIKISVLRMRGQKGKLESLGENADDIESVSKMQTQILNMTKGAVNIMDSADPTKFRDYYDVMSDIAEILPKLNQTDQSNLIETLFGKNRANQGQAILQAFQSGQIQKAYQTALNSAGSAQKEQDRWLQSAEAKIQQFKAQFQSLSTTAIDSNVFKGLIDSGTTLLNILTQLIDVGGGIPLMLGAIGGTAFIKNLDLFYFKLVTSYERMQRKWCCKQLCVVTF